MTASLIGSDRKAAATTGSWSAGVEAQGEQDDQRPVLFYRGAYTVTEPAEPTPGNLDNLITSSRDDEWA